MALSRPTWANLPRSAADWQGCYYLNVPDNRLAPRVGEGELLILDPKAKPEVGNVVAIWFGSPLDGDSACVVGVLTALTAKSASIRLDLTSDVAQQITVTADRTMHAAVGAMVRLDRPEDRANLAINAAIRERDSRDV